MSQLDSDIAYLQAQQNAKNGAAQAAQAAPILTTLYNPAVDPNSIFFSTGQACSDGYFYNTATGQCETFVPGSGAPPPAVSPNVPWGFWQWAALVGGLGLAGLVVYSLYARHEPHAQ